MLSRLRSDLVYRLRRLIRRDAVEGEIADELRFHLECETEKLVAEGTEPAEAARLARVAFGGVERFKDETRDSHGTLRIEAMLQDLRYALRGLRARPAFTLGILLTLGLGIGANAAMFGIVDRVLFRPPAMMRDPDLVHRLYRRTVDDGEVRNDRNFSFPTFQSLRRNTPALAEIAAFQTVNYAIGEGEDTRELPVTVASANYFGFFDATPALGRFFTAAEDSIPEGTAVAVLGYAAWQERFGGRNVIGEPLRIGSHVFTIVGVAPKGFTGMSDQRVPAAYIPITTHAFHRRGATYPSMVGWSWLEMIGRRRPDVAVSQADAVLTQAFATVWRETAQVSPGWGTPEAAQVQGIAAPVLLQRGPEAGRDSRVALLIGGVALVVLLIACANVANLMLARAASRQREVALRLALGVTRWRLTRQLLTETALLAIAGGTVGLVVAHWGGTTIRALFMPPEFAESVATDGRTLLFTAVATIAAALLTGLAPAWNAGRADVVSGLKAGTRGAGGRRSRAQAGLLVFQAALSMLLLAGAGIFVSSLENAQKVRLGYDPESVMVAEVNLRGATVEPSQFAALAGRLREAAINTPGVSQAAFAASAPYLSNDQMGIAVPGVDSANSKGRFLIQFATPGYFETMGTRIIRGRPLDERDRAGSEPVAVVSEGMARILWPGRDAIDQTFQLSGPGTTLRIVGIAEDIRLRNFVDPREFTYYVSAEQHPDGVGATILFVRTRGPAAEAIAVVRARLQETLPPPAYVSVLSLSEVVDPSYRAWRFAATMFVTFGALALVLAAVGLYSLVAYDVAQRTREMGVRMALGARGSQVVRQVVWDGVRLVSLGIGIGIVLAMLSAPRAQALMFAQEALDPVILSVVAVTLIVVGGLAALPPALRASRVDPAEVLRGE